MNFKLTIRKIVSIFASSEFAFIYCIIGTLAQTSHTWYLISSISSLTGINKSLQAFALSLFISSSLLFFTAIADNADDSKESKRIHLAVNLFMVIEILINTYYYGSHLLLKVTEPKIFDFIFALLVSCLIPVTIKLYAGVIKAKSWIKSLEAEQEIVPEPVFEPIPEQAYEPEQTNEPEQTEEIEEDKTPEIFSKNKPEIIKLNQNN